MRVGREKKNHFSITDQENAMIAKQPESVHYVILTCKVCKVFSKADKDL